LVLFVALAFGFPSNSKIPSPGNYTHKLERGFWELKGGGILDHMEPG